jgi:hypothetical protein
MDCTEAVQPNKRLHLSAAMSHLAGSRRAARPPQVNRER